IDIVLTCPYPGFTRRPPPDKETRRQGDKEIWGDRICRSPGLLVSWSDVSSFVFRLSSLVQPYFTLLRYAMLLRASRYDLAIIGRDDHWWGAALALLAGVPRRIGFGVRECRPFLTDALPWDPRAHVTAQGLALVESVVRSPLSVAASYRQRTTDDGPRTTDNSPFSTRYDPSPEDITWADNWLRSQGFGAEEWLVLLHPGTAGPAKLWFPQRWAAVADALADLGVRLVITGGPGEEALVEDVAGRMHARPLTLAGRTTVGQLAALLRRSALALGVDSGPLHLAAAQGVPTLHLYGPSDAGRFGPWGDPARHVVIRADLWCSPCGVFSSCPRGLARPECMEQIDVARVIAQARRQLDASRRK
ncbi:MAG TPA: glycosyltransferase family 9 protein, partial [Roseiflexaceae bacterium]